MNHYTILGCADTLVAMILEILSTMHDDQVSVDIVKNMVLDGTRHPYQTEGIVSRELYSEDWQKNEGTNYVIGVVKPASKLIVQEYFSKHFSVRDEDFSILIHRHTSIASTAGIEKGVIINPGVVVAPYCMVERYVTVNRNVSLGHHSRIGEFTQINPAVNIAGNCSIGKNVVLGMGAMVFDGVSIGDNSIIGGGSLVTKNIPGNVLAYGSPAKAVRDLI